MTKRDERDEKIVSLRGALALHEQRLAAVEKQIAAAAQFIRPGSPPTDNSDLLLANRALTALALELPEAVHKSVAAILRPLLDELAAFRGLAFLKTTAKDDLVDQLAIADAGDRRVLGELRAWLLTTAWAKEGAAAIGALDRILGRSP